MTFAFWCPVGQLQQPNPAAAALMECQKWFPWHIKDSLSPSQNPTLYSVFQLVSTVATESDFHFTLTARRHFHYAASSADLLFLPGFSQITFLDLSYLCFYFSLYTLHQNSPILVGMKPKTFPPSTLTSSTSTVGWKTFSLKNNKFPFDTSLFAFDHPTQLFLNRGSAKQKSKN